MREGWGIRSDTSGHLANSVVVRHDSSPSLTARTPNLGSPDARASRAGTQAVRQVRPAVRRRMVPPVSGSGGLAGCCFSRAFVALVSHRAGGMLLQERNDLGPTKSSAMPEVLARQ